MDVFYHAVDVFQMAIYYLIAGSVDVLYHAVDDDVHDVLQNEGDNQMAVDDVTQAS